MHRYRLVCDVRQSIYVSHSGILSCLKVRKTKGHLDFIVFCKYSFCKVG